MEGRKEIDRVEKISFSLPKLRHENIFYARKPGKRWNLISSLAIHTLNGILRVVRWKLFIAWVGVSAWLFLSSQRPWYRLCVEWQAAWMCISYGGVRGHSIRWRCFCGALYVLIGNCLGSIVAALRVDGVRRHFCLLCWKNDCFLKHLAWYCSKPITKSPQ